MAAPDLEKPANEAFVDDNFELAIILHMQALELSPASIHLFADRAQILSPIQTKPSNWIAPRPKLTCKNGKSQQWSDGMVSGYDKDVELKCDVEKEGGSRMGDWLSHRLLPLITELGVHGMDSHWSYRQVWSSGQWWMSSMKQSKGNSSPWTATLHCEMRSCESGGLWQAGDLFGIH